jgi:hypothetical protein
MREEKQVKRERDKLKKTRVDDILVEMIKPKLTEIETKFSEGKGLSQDDINTLLLKSQYNHINHLDDKLNEVTNHVSSLKVEFKFSEEKMTNNYNLLRSEFKGLEEKMINDYKLLRSEFKGLEEKVENKLKLMEEKIEKSIEKALNKNMVILVTVMGVFLTLSKLIDKFM